MLWRTITAHFVHRFWQTEEGVTQVKELFMQMRVAWAKVYTSRISWACVSVPVYRSYCQTWFSWEDTSICNWGYRKNSNRQWEKEEMLKTRRGQGNQREEGETEEQKRTWEEEERSKDERKEKNRVRGTVKDMKIIERRKEMKEIWRWSGMVKWSKEENGKLDKKNGEDGKVEDRNWQQKTEKELKRKSKK